ncbi:MAG: hypothetical protein ACE3JU_26425 [Paenibacillus sp.]|uniref:hypothetical protein n=1 Tax=Paenibacillus sp. TaxID=58172 RepID=UPI003B7AF4C1
MPDGYVPPSFRDFRPIPGIEHLDPIEWDTPETFREDATNLLQSFPSLQSPLHYFSLFFDNEVLSFLAESTNEYASAKRAERVTLRSVETSQEERE